MNEMVNISDNVKGLFISSSDYDTDLAALHGAKNAVDALFGLLNTDKRLNFRSDCIDYIENPSSVEAIDRITSLINSYNPEDSIFLLYFCGHGIRVNSSGLDLCLATKDTSSTNAESIGIRISILKNMLRQKQIKRYIIILDCCYSGIAGRMGLFDDDNQLFQDLPEGAMVLMSCKSNEVSSEIDVAGTSFAAYTYYLKVVLQRGTENGNNLISFSEIHQQICKLMRTKRLSTPQIISANRLSEEYSLRNMWASSLEEKNIANSMATNSAIKVLLVKTAIDNFIKDYDFGIPLGLWLLKSYIQLQGIDAEVHIYDERLARKRNEFLDFEKMIAEFDMIGISMCTSEVPNAIKKFKIAKKLGKITVAGGIFVFGNEDYLFLHDCVDYVIPGVATFPFATLIKHLLQLKKNGKKLDSSPCIAPGIHSSNSSDRTDLWKPCQLPNIELRVWKEIISQYSPYIDSKVDIFTSRGCNKRCSFCSVQRECQQNPIVRDIDSIAEELNFLMSQGISHFSIKDEDFLLYDRARFKDILSAFRNSNISFKIRTRLDSMMKTDFSLEDIANLNITEIQYGIESSNSSILKQVKKGLSFESKNVSSFLREHAKYGITTNTSFIMGIAGEDDSYYYELEEFIQQLFISPVMSKIYINFLTPHPFRNEFPLYGYKLVTNDLKYFTHKNPVAYPADMKRLTRSKMLNMYSRIVKATDSRRYNPRIPEEVWSNFKDDLKFTPTEIMMY